MQQVQLNIIPFKPLVDKLSFAFYDEKQKGFISISWDKIMGSIKTSKVDLVKNTSVLRINSRSISSAGCMEKRKPTKPAVTIKYPEMVAEIFPYFTHDKLPDHGKESLWFL